MMRRRGHLLAEALCALALTGILAAAAAATLSGTRSAIRRADERASAERTAREALAVTAAMLRTADSVIILGDTAVEFSMTFGVAVICAADSALYFPPTRLSVGRPMSVWIQPPEVGDALSALVFDSLSSSWRWKDEEVDGVASVSIVAPCDVANGWVPAGDGAARLTRLVLRTPLDGAVTGAAVRLSRRGRLALYVDGKGDWMLGWRRCGLGTCGVIQPIAGPLRTPGAGGFRVGAAAGGGWTISIRVPGSDRSVETKVPSGDALR